MLTPNNPMGEYASSSCLVVLRPMAQHIRWAMLKFENRRCRVKTVHGMPVIWEEPCECRLRPDLPPLAREEHDNGGGDELLECPPPRVPSTLPEWGVLGV